ncbi:hypothetical protein GYMLUDRAFT_60747 [Collybiopsis luxurians FD-317 M1]|uniref:Uncharacterized protein n=1 Tax=Collybiopsis luxurians FD-317 M1 TaxID=944289 RepID=A0A0D0C6L9_9AGAR|nr:hypothetical protein GYMLUDRAFT_60747 [Collybiopsis luxurians FD-317 M1]
MDANHHFSSPDATAAETKRKSSPGTEDRKPHHGSESSIRELKRAHAKCEDKWRRHLEAKDNQIRDLTRLLSSADHRNRELERSLSIEHRKNQDLQFELRQTQRENQMKNDQMNDLQYQLSVAQTDIHRSQQKLAENQELLDARRRELEGAQAFLNTTDAYSGAEIVGMVKGFNAEVFQVAAFITDTIEESFHPRQSKGCDSESLAVTEKYLGPRVVSFLRHIAGAALEDQVTVVQNALQSGLNCLSYKVLRQWSTDADANDAFNKVYSGIRARTNQTVISGTWRSLTRAHIKHAVYHHDHILQNFGKLVQAVLTVAGWWPEKDSEVETIIDKQVSRIVELLAKLDEAMTERIISMEMMLKFPHPGTGFNSREMEDADGGRKTLDGTVLFVSEVGLEKIDSKDGKFQSTVLLKSKVLLEEAFADMKNGHTEVDNMEE